MARTCIINGRTGLCTDVIEASGDVSEFLGEGYIAIADSSGKIGDAWSGGRWISPAELAIRGAPSPYAAEQGNIASFSSPSSIADAIDAVADRASLLLNGGLSVNRLRADTSVALSNGAYAADRHYVLTNTSSVVLDYGEDITAPYSEYGVLYVGLAASQRAAVCNILEFDTFRSRIGRQCVLSGSVRRSGGSAPFGVKIAFINAGANHDVVNSWASASYTPGGFFKADCEVLALQSIAVDDADVWIDFEMTVALPSALPAVFEPLAMMITDTAVSTPVQVHLNWRIDDGVSPQRRRVRASGRLRDKVYAYLSDGTFGTSFDHVGPYAYIDVELQAGGGGGRGVTAAASQVAIGTGGAGGGWVAKRLYPDQITNYLEIFVGAGGAGNSGSGGAGGDTYITCGGVELCRAIGGAGGVNALAAGTAQTFTGGTPIGGGGTGDVVVPGGGCILPGFRVSGTIGWSVSGGNSRLGTGGRFVNDGSSGNAGTGYGSGGSGGCSNSTTNRQGGDGAPGICIVRPAYL